MFEYSREMCIEIARDCKTSIEFRRKNGSAYNKARKRGWFSDYTWFVDGRTLGLNGRWTEASCCAEARKYARKVDFQRKASGAYKYAVDHKLLETFAWFENASINLETDRIYCVYRYVFETEAKRYVYVGLTMRPTVRDRRHREGDSAVYDFAKEHGLEIPEMEIVERNLTQIAARDKEDVIRRIYEASPDFVVLNRAKTGKGVGSIGGMHRKWGRKACLEEAKKFSSRGEFEKGSPSAYQAACSKRWLGDYTWFEAKHHHAWTKEEFLSLAKQYTSIKEFQKSHNGAYIAGCLRGWLRLCDWFEPGQGWDVRVSRKRRDSRVVLQYTKEGVFVARHENLANAIRASGVMSLRKCLTGERKQAGGFVWKYE